MSDPYKDQLASSGCLGRALSDEERKYWSDEYEKQRTPLSIRSAVEQEIAEWLRSLIVPAGPGIAGMPAHADDYARRLADAIASGAYRKGKDG